MLQLHNASGLQTATLGNSSNASVGEDVVGVGNAGGTGGTPSAAGGTVTALNQSITASDEGDGTSEQLSGLIETNADIQPGDSGGALVDTSGQVLGIDTAASAGFSFQSNGQSQGTQGFAIPINTALSIARAIEAGTGVVDRPHRADRLPRRRDQPVRAAAPAAAAAAATVAASVASSAATAATPATPATPGRPRPGASVAGVVTNGPAQEAGLAQGDVITSLGGKTISSANDLTNAMSAVPPGRQGDGRLDRQLGQTHTATVQLSLRARRSSRQPRSQQHPDAEAAGVTPDPAASASLVYLRGQPHQRDRPWPGPLR